MKKIIPYACLFVLFYNTGCALRVTNGIGHTIGDSTRQHVNRLAWGLVNSGVNKPRCANGINDVKIKSNFGDTFFTIVTLGIYCPTTVIWWCSNKNIDPGN